MSDFNARRCAALNDGRSVLLGRAGESRWRRRALICTLLGAMAVFAYLPDTQAQELNRQQFTILGVPDPSIIEAHDGAEYFIFSTGAGISIWRSRDHVKWTSAGRVFTDDVPPWAAKRIPGARSIWAPDICFVNGKYYLYYSVSTLGSQRSVIGLAVNNTLDSNDATYQWEDRGLILESDAATDDFNAIDPALFVDDDDHAYLFWGSYWAGIKAGQVNLATGRLLSPAARSVSIARRAARATPAIEGAYVIKHDGYYYLFVSWDHALARQPTDTTYKVMVGRSISPLGPYVDASGRKMIDGHAELVLMGDLRWHGPGHNSILQTPQQDWLVHHVVDARHPKAGRVLQIRPLQWRDGWPTAGEPVGHEHEKDEQSATSRLIGRWQHRVGDRDAYDIFLEPNGFISGTKGQARWQVDGASLLLKWPSSKAPGGYWIDRVTIGSYGKSYAGTNQNGTLISGKKTGDSS